MYSLATISTLLATALAAAVPSARVDYKGYRVVRVPGEPDVAKNLINNLKLHPLNRHGGQVDLMVPPDVAGEFEKLADGLDVKTLHKDLGSDIESEGSPGVYKAGSLNEDWFTAYHEFDDHIQWLNDLHAAHKETSEVVVVGQSLEGKNITGIHLWGAEGKDKKPAVVFHGTVHAREWITTMVAEYIANSLFNTEPDVKAIVDKFDIYVVPIVNPDGFVFTQTTDRMWRKNRQPHESSECLGRDINRNWPYEWEGEGSSPDPCSESFRGEKPGDSPEIKVHTEFLQKLADGNGLKLFVDLHSYSQLFMSPYGYSCSALPENNDLHQSLAKSWADAVTGVHGTEFTTGPICDTIYPTNGNSVDWIVDVAGGETAFAAELRDTGEHGFILPPDQIKPSGEETWAGFMALLAELK